MNTQKKTTSTQAKTTKPTMAQLLKVIEMQQEQLNSLQELIKAQKQPTIAKKTPAKKVAEKPIEKPAICLANRLDYTDSDYSTLKSLLNSYRWVARKKVDEDGNVLKDISAMSAKRIAKQLSDIRYVASKFAYILISKKNIIAIRKNGDYGYINNTALKGKWNTISLKTAREILHISKAYNESDFELLKDIK